MVNDDSDLCKWQINEGHENQNYWDSLNAHYLMIKWWIFIHGSCWKLTSISFQEIKKKKHSTYEIIINNEGSGSRINQAEEFKAKSVEELRAISTNIQSQLAKKIQSKKSNQKKKKKKKKKSAAESQSKIAILERSWSGPRRIMLTSCQAI